MDKNQILIKGKITEIFPKYYEVLLENGQKMNCSVSGKLKYAHVRIIRGDDVEVEISIYDLTKGVIVKRF
jgi:translation initiation factor IF-1